MVKRVGFLSDEDKKLGGKKTEDTSASAGQDSFALSEAELLCQLPQAMSPSLFLNRFSHADMQARLEASSFLSALIAKGVHKPRMEILRVEPEEHRLLMFDDSGPQPLRMVELRMSLTRMEMPGRMGLFTSRGPAEMLAVNWIMMQNPRAHFTSERPQLPGQEFPGLGLGRKCHEFLVQLASELRRDGLINFPQFFHNAVIYQDAYFFADPERQGQLLAMIRDLSKYPIAQASHAIADGKLLRLPERVRIEWNPGPMVCPVRRRLKRSFRSSEYRRAVERAQAMQGYDLAL
jgi:hypothetical protein